MKRVYLYLSELLAALIVSTGIYGLLFKDAYIKETANWTAQVIAQDWVNLLLGVPVLLVSAFLAYRNSLRAYFVWLGTLVFIAYSYVIYAFNIHYNQMFYPYVAILGLSFYMLVFSLANLDFQKIKDSFKAGWAGRGLSNLLLTTGILFYLMWLSSVAAYLIKGTFPVDLNTAGLVTNPVHVLDMAIFLPSAIISAILLKKKSKYGYVFPFVILIAMVLLSINIIAINVVVEMRGLGSARVLSYVFSGIVAIYLAVLYRSFKKLKKVKYEFVSYL